jgi:hypothetical protein
VVAERRARAPVRPLAREPRRDQPVVGQLGEAEPGIRADHPGAVGEQLSQRDVLLALLGELRPVVADPLVGIQHAVLHQQRNHEVRRSLRGGEHPGQRVGREPGPCPQIHDQLAAHVGDHLARVVRALPRDDLRELLAHVLVARRDRALHPVPPPHRGSRSR